MHKYEMISKTFAMKLHISTLLPGKHTSFKAERLVL